MQQLWLIEAAAVSESMPPLELDSRLHDELVVAMAAAIESMHFQQANLPLETKDALTYVPTITTTSKDHSGAPQPQSDCLSQTVLAEASRAEPGKPAATICNGRTGQGVGIHASRND